MKCVAVLLALVWCDISPIEGAFRDLTWFYNDKMSRFPTHPKFELKDDWRGPVNKIPFMATNILKTGEHIGTHVDAPFHVNANAKKLGEIPFSYFHGPAVVIDIRERAKKDGNAQVHVQDLMDWEKRCGKIGDGAWVIMNSGWGARYWGTMDFLGTNDTTKPSTYTWPGISPEAGLWLMEQRQQFHGVAVDSVSCDSGNETAGQARVHLDLLPRDKLCVENIAHLEKLPDRCDMELHILPMNIKEGTGAPARIYASWDDAGGRRFRFNGATRMTLDHLTGLLIVATVLGCLHF